MFMFFYCQINKKNINATATLAKTTAHGAGNKSGSANNRNHVARMCSACDVIVKNQCVICVKIIYVMTYILLIVKASLVS